MSSQKKDAGLAILRSEENFIVRRLNEADATSVVTLLGADKFVDALTPYETFYTVGQVNSTVGMGFTEIPAGYNLAIMIVKDCGFTVAILDDGGEIAAVVNSLGGEAEFKETAYVFSNMYKATSTEGSGSLCPICL
jgi:hypothetical protein